MKPIFSKIRVLGTAALALFLTASCSDILDEQPRSSYDPTFFKTEKGVEGGVTSMYAHLRYIYGQAYYYNSCLTGTDEATWGWSADGNFKDADGLRRSAVMACALGCDGKWAIHPSQIEVINEVFTPSQQDIVLAAKVIQADEQAKKEGRGAVAVEGRMVDQATVRLATQLWQQAKHLGLV